MGIRNKKQETLRRLDSKTLDASTAEDVQARMSGFRGGLK